LVGVAPNTQASGARITVRNAGTSQMREISIASNFVSQNPTVQLFGIGSFERIDELSVQWPDGETTVLTDISAGQQIEIIHPYL
jgi:hypothetical protein